MGPVRRTHNTRRTTIYSVAMADVPSQSQSKEVALAQRLALTNILDTSLVRITFISHHANSYLLVLSASDSGLRVH